MNEGLYPLSKVFYHVTPASNVDDIIMVGIMPCTLTKTGLRRTYAVRIGGLQWAIDHVRVRHNIPLDMIAVCLIKGSDEWFCYNRDTWYTYHQQYPESIVTADSLTSILK